MRLEIVFAENTGHLTLRVVPLLIWSELSKFKDQQVPDNQPSCSRSSQQNNAAHVPPDANPPSETITFRIAFVTQFSFFFFNSI